MASKYFLSIIVIITISMQGLMAIDIAKLPNNMSVSRALYINCLQRTQTQQLLKEYIMIGLSFNYNNPKERLAKALVKYTDRLEKLDDFFQPLIQDSTIKQQLTRAKEIWKESRALLELAPTKENALVLQKNFVSMVKLLGKVKVLSTKSFKAIRLTGGLCRNSLYMVNEYLMKVWGVKNKDYKDNMEQYISHFQENIKYLEEYKNNTPQINKHIKKAKRKFMFFEFMYNSDNVSIPTLLSKKADSIFIDIHSIKKLYAELAIK